MTDPSSPNSQPQGLDAVSVRLSFDVGELSLSLNELQALQPGQVLDLARPTARLVNIRANGMLVGLGELVDVDGRLGVMVAQVGPTTQGNA